VYVICDKQLEYH